MLFDHTKKMVQPLPYVPKYPIALKPSLANLYILACFLPGAFFSFWYSKRKYPIALKPSLFLNEVVTPVGVHLAFLLHHVHVYFSSFAL